VREANDRGFDCLVLADCTGSYFPEFYEAALAMFSAQGGIVCWVGDSAALLAAIEGGSVDASLPPVAPAADPVAPLEGESA